MTETSDLALMAYVEPRYLGRDLVYRFLRENHREMAREFKTYGWL